ncbi:MAG: hypothetical protein IJS30_06105 [Bacteroidales bacterium]|nr:hypothetical protein [Bacteroidales bacterium]
MRKCLRTILVSALTLVTAFSCIKPEDEVSYQEQQRRQAAVKTLNYLWNLMSEHYYWNESLVKKSFTYDTDVNDYFESLLYEKDRWSWMTDGKTFMDDETGIQYGTYGIMVGQMIRYYRDPGIYICYVYAGGPFDTAGVKRGWKITKIDGKTTEDWIENDLKALNNLFNYPSTTQPHLFTFEDTKGETHEASIIAAESLLVRPSLATKVFTAKDYPGLPAPVGYFNYLSFKADNDVNGKSMMDDITEAMDYFKKQNVKTLILDLRYNGGGDSRASNLLVSYLAPASARGQVYVKRTHNQKKRASDLESTVMSPSQAISAIESDKSSTIHFSCKPDSPEFEHLYFITGKGSASASEMVLNGLKPLADIHHVGDTTYGKPNGMYVFLYPSHLAAYDKGDYSGLQYVFLPICFYNSNGLGENIPDTGIIPDNGRPDDLHHDFDATEDNIAACLHHIVHGTYPALPEAPAQTKASICTDAHLYMWETDKNYGRYTVKRDF